MKETGYAKYISGDLARCLGIAGYPLREIQVYNGERYFDELDRDEEGWCDCKRWELPTFAQVFDWLSKEGYHIDIYHDIVFTEEGDAYIDTDNWVYAIDGPEHSDRSVASDEGKTYGKSWTEVAKIAIRKVLEIRVHQE